MIRFGSSLLVLALFSVVVTDARAGFRPDFDGDHIDDFVVFRPGPGPEQGYWYVFTSSGVCTPPLVATGFGGCRVQWGLTGDIPLTGDINADGKSDFIVYRPSNNTFYVLYSNGQGNAVVQLGQQGDLPDVVDENGDGRGDLAVYRQNGGTGTWYVRVWTPGGPPPDGSITYMWSFSLGLTPIDPLGVVSAHYADGSPGYIQTSNYFRLLSNNVAYQYWAIRYRTNLIATEQIQCPSTACFVNVPVTGNYGGQAAGLADYVYWNASTGLWTVIFNGVSSPQSTTYPWGLGSNNGYSDQPIGGDYDGDGVQDYTVWRTRDPNGPWGQYWFVVPSHGACPAYMQTLPPPGGGCAKQWGLPGDIPVGYSNSQPRM
jgi:hypothetical protein